MKVLAAVFVAATLSAAPEQKPQKAPAPSGQHHTEMTGCIDQRGEKYVLTSPADMSVLTGLKGKAFADDNFARFIGQKVKVEGQPTGEVLEVVKITKLADTCSR